VRRTLIPAALIGLTLYAQAPPKLEFDVVSIKFDDTGTGGAGDQFPNHGTWKWTRIPLSFLISNAYDVSLTQIANIPGKFLSRDVAFDIVAKMPANVTDEQFRAMMQSMLADRFHFAMHREMREIPVVMIEVAKGGPKLKSASGDCVPVPHSTAVPKDQRRCGEVTRSPRVQDGMIRWQYSGRSVSMGDLAALLSSDRPVMDNTGLKGLYDLDVTIESPVAPSPNNADEAASQQFEFYRAFNAAFEKQAGLSIDMGKLTKHPMPVIVVDHVEIPTPN